MALDSDLEELKKWAIDHMKLADQCEDVSDRYFHQRQAELYLKRLEIEVRIKSADNVVVGLYKIAGRLR